jgi:hypothetical protein
MHERLSASTGARRRSKCAAVLRRVTVTMVAAALVIAAEVAATLNATIAKAPTTPRGATSPVRALHPPAPGEPELQPVLNAPFGPRLATVKFVRDYALWSSGRLPAMPARDATRRVTQLLEQQGRQARVVAADAIASIRIARAPDFSYVVTSAVGNFLVGRRGPRWLVISLPGD